MALAALICAYQDAAGPGGRLRATLPLAGRTLLERQARLAAAAGADPILVLVERLPPDLIAALDRLRGEGISIRVARTVAEAAEAVHPHEPLLLIADGLIADAEHFGRIANASGATLLSRPDDGDETFERIDADSRWAGIARLDGAMLRRTAAMLGEWDLQSTLLRHAVQADVRQVALRGDSEDAPLTIAQRDADLIAIEQKIVESANAARGGWASRYILAPIERLATRLLMPTRVTPDLLRFAAAGLTIVAAVLFARDWLWVGGAVMLAATPLDGAADRLSLLRMEQPRIHDWWAQILPALAAIALAALGFSLSATFGWGSLLLVAVTLAFLLALHGETRGDPVPAAEWLAERKGMTLLMLPFALTWNWIGGLGALALYAAASFFWAQRAVHRPAAPPADED
ncbi:hypothetical protein [Allosphingosinicella indica]|uniref:Uncharacterized protein n=1 Tax=Allosphingosinicella indica TaxID=941907 RepID=A0A1X7GY70_9SPHN|nr:hypothetical protein [Allosphingosinicella indica]SMF75794.1 hypothetical protein SAMN06295910_2381 [Allosphingosinicella indica]